MFLTRQISCMPLDRDDIGYCSIGLVIEIDNYRFLVNVQISQIGKQILDMLVPTNCLNYLQHSEIAATVCGMRA